jgi:hypothetical protein
VEEVRRVLPAAEQVKETADLAAEHQEGRGRRQAGRFWRRWRTPFPDPTADSLRTGGRATGVDSPRVPWSSRKPPFPLLWQRETDEGHKRSVIVGRVDKAERLEHGGIGNLEGVFDTHVDAVEAARQVGASS